MTFNQKQYAKITSWTDVFNLTGFTDSLDPKKEKLKLVINKYELPKKGKCGLSNCGTPHFSGYIVETESGKLTNIGHCCDKNYFGKDFTILKNKLDKEIDYLNKVKTIQAAKINVKTKIDELTKLEADWRKIEEVYQVLQTERLDIILNKLELMKRQKSSVISLDRKASKSEIELEEARTGEKVKSPFYITESFGELKGLSYISSRATNEAMFRNINSEILRIKKFDEKDKKLKELTIMVKHIKDLEDHIHKAEGLMADGFNLFNRRNMEQLAPLVSKKKQRKFKRFLNTCFKD